MKKVFLAFLSLVFVLILASCANDVTEQTAPVETIAETSTAEETTLVTTTETSTAVETTEATTTAEATTEAAATEATTDSAATEETTEPAETTAAGPVNTADMYSSYAFLVSYDPETGWADFDYFDMLIGDDAVQWLTDVEGYELVDAQALVDDFADSEFILKNVNPQLRTIDLTDLPLRLMYKPDGTMISMPSEWPFDTNINDFNAVYVVDPDLLLDSFFFYIEVEEGTVKSVEQVYWP